MQFRTIVQIAIGILATVTWHSAQAESLLGRGVDDPERVLSLARRHRPSRPQLQQHQAGGQSQDAQIKKVQIRLRKLNVMTQYIANHLRALAAGKPLQRRTNDDQSDIDHLKKLLDDAKQMISSRKAHFARDDASYNEVQHLTSQPLESLYPDSSIPSDARSLKEMMDKMNFELAELSTDIGALKAPTPALKEEQSVVCEELKSLILGLRPSSIADASASASPPAPPLHRRVAPGV